MLTIHRSKGLEFPIVYCPYLWETGYEPKGVPVVFHDPDADDRRTLDVGLEGAGFQRHKQQQLVEQRGEDLRLAYVALTRAQHQAVVWWAGSFDSRNSPLGRLLFARDAAGVVAPSGPSKSDAEAVERLEALAAQAAGCISVERAARRVATRWSGAPREPAALSASRFERELDRGWRRTSYSDLTAGTHEPRVASEPEEPLVEDEPAAPAPAAAAPGADDAALRAVPSLLAEMPAGVHVGTFVHRVLERDRLRGGRPRRRAGGPGRRRRGGRSRSATRARSSAGCARRWRRRSARCWAGWRCATCGARTGSTSSTFELPLAGGDAPTGRARAGRDRGRPARPPAAGRPARGLRRPARRPGAAPHRARLPHRQHRPRRADGRRASRSPTTRRTGSRRPGEELSAWHHRPAALAGEMERAHYGLQALLYTVALHRYLRWRLPDYEPERHLAGVVYLFVRGMTGPGTPLVGGAPCGVFAWKPPGALVVALSDVLERGSGRDRGRRRAGPVRRAPRAPGARAAGRVQRGGRARRGRRARGAADRRAGRRRRPGVLLAAALAVRGPRLGHVYVDLATVRDTATVEADEPVDLGALPWPEAAGWARRLAASPLVAAGEDDGAADRPLRLVGTRLYLDRYWREERRLAADLLALERGDARRRAAGRARGRAGAHVRRGGGRRAAPGGRDRGPAPLRRRRRRPRHRQDDDRRADRRAARRAGRGGRRRRAARRARRADREGRRAARGGGARRGARARRRRRGARAAARAGRRRRCTGCSAGSRARTAASATTAGTGSRTTWSSSTRPRWSRSR